MPHEVHAAVFDWSSGADRRPRVRRSRAMRSRIVEKNGSTMEANAALRKHRAGATHGEGYSGPMHGDKLVPKESGVRDMSIKPRDLILSEDRKHQGRKEGI